MPEMSIELASLRAENEFLKQQISTVTYTNDLILAFLAFIIAIVVACCLALREELCRLWHQYEEVMLLAHHKPRDRLLRMHDNFNLLVLPVVVLLDARFAWGGGLSEDKNPRFWHMLWFTVGYIMIDMVWVALFPKCVKSQVTILVHHAVTLLYMGIPMFNPLTRYAMSACLSVELNTWFLILRRTPFGQGRFRWLVSVPFYVSWYVIRIGIYPYMIYDVTMLFFQHIEKLKIVGDPAWARCSYGLTYMAIPPLFQTALSALNIHWTVQLNRSLLRNKGPDKGL